MKPHSISTIINFSTNEAAFLSQCINEAFHFSDEIIIPVCDHFFDGTAENIPLLRSIYAAHPGVKFIEFPFSDEYQPAYQWHNLARLVGLAHSSHDHLLFLDADEIPEGKKVAHWLKTTPVKKAHRMACYWYFKSPTKRATTLEDSPLFIHREEITHQSLMHPHERRALFHLAQGDKETFTHSQDPLFHHYSWVRPKEGLLRKVRSWGHRDDRDWEALLKKEEDFVHGYTYQIVPSYLKPNTYNTSQSKLPFKQLTNKELKKLELTLLINNFLI